MNERARLRLVVLRVLMLSLLLSLIARLYYMQVQAPYSIPGVTTRPNPNQLLTAPIRGEILDAAGRPLASNRSQLVVSLDRVELYKHPEIQATVLFKLAKLLKINYTDLLNSITPCGPGGVPGACWQGQPYAPIPISQDTPPAVAQQIVEHLEEYPGVSVAPQPVRHYDKPAGVNAAQMLGYLGVQTAQDGTKFAGYARDQLVGRAGLESQYESVLAGKPGVEYVQLDARNQISGVTNATAPVAGDNLVLSIDAQVQALAESSIAQAVKDDPGNPINKTNYVKATTAAAVVMDAKTGRLLALASYPSYDPSVWVGGISQKAYAQLTSNPNFPLVDKAISGQYPPGSTFKLASGIAAIDDGLASFDGTTYKCSGSVQVGNRVFHNDEGLAAGALTLHDVYVQSCDTTFYQWAISQWKTDEARILAKLPPKQTAPKVARQFGFGTATGVDLPGESSGLIEDRALKVKIDAQLRSFNCKEMNDPKQTPEQRAIARDNCNSVGTWQIGDQANFNIGQGTVLSTPLQLATAYAALANGGTLYQPTLGWGVLGPDGKVVQTITPAVRRHLTVNPTTLADIRSAMCQVPTIGTAASAFVGFDFSKVTVCGKTGTAQTTSAHDSTSWFTSFGGPVNDPNRYVVTVVVPDGGYGAAAAGPAVRRIYDGMFGLGGKTPIQLATSLPKYRSDGTVIHPVPLSVPKPTSTPTPSGTPGAGSPTATPTGASPTGASPTGAPPTGARPSSPPATPNGTTSGAALLLSAPPVGAWLRRRRRRRDPT